MGVLADGQYIIRNSSTELVLTLERNASDNGAPVYCKRWTSESSKWDVDLVSRNEDDQVDQNQYTIKSVYPVRYAYYKKVSVNARSHDECTWLISRKDQWIGPPHSEHVLTCNSTNEGAQVILASKTGRQDQLWEFRKSAPPPSTAYNSNILSGSAKTQTYLLDLKGELDGFNKNFQSDPTCNGRVWKAAETVCLSGYCDDAISTIKDYLSHTNGSKTLTVLVYNLEGKKAMVAKNYSLAIDHYVKAIGLDGTYSVSYANRSEALALGGKLDAALADAEKSIRLDPISGLGYRRKADILDLLCNLDDSDLKDRLIKRVTLGSSDDSASGTNDHAIPKDNVQNGPAINSQTKPSTDSRSNVFFTIKIGGNEAGKIVFKLYDDWAPNSAKSFRELAMGIHNFGYKGLRFYSVMPGRCFGGEFVDGLSRQGKSIYDPPQKVETHNFRKTFKPGLLYLVDKTTIDSKFVIAMKMFTPQNKFGSPIGEVDEGLDIVEKICATDARSTVIIVDSGCVP